MNIWLTILIAVFVFSLFVFVHELGHFLTAKLFKIKVLEFAIGMGPAIFKKKRGETLYAIRCIPMGGYCKMEGEDAESDDDGAFNKKKWWQRLIVLVSGAAMNLLTGFIICFIIVMVNGVVVSPVVDTVIQTAEGEAFLQPGDRILKVNNADINLNEDIILELLVSNNQPVDVTILRGNEVLTQKISPVLRGREGEQFYFLPFDPREEPLNPINAISQSFFQTVYIEKTIFVSFGMLFSGQADLSQASGAVGIVREIGNALNVSFIQFLFIAALLTINLGIVNLMPFPALDGGRILFIIIELIRRKPMTPKVEGLIHFIGFSLLVILMVLLLFNDIWQIIIPPA